jgi:hypothetical protein
LDPAPSQTSIVLLPRSGIGVDETYLVISPPGNPAIQLDARLLDRIELIGRSPRSAFATSAVAGLGVAAAALSIIPGGVFACAGLGYWSYERFSEGWRRKKSRDLLLAIGDLEVALHVSDGPEAARRVAEQLAPYTRSAPITRPEVYEDARRRLHARAEGRVAVGNRDFLGALTVGDEVVTVADGYLRVGPVAFTIDEVRQQALRGGNLSLPGARLLQAAMGLLVVAAHDRARDGEDVEALSRRIAQYEAWSGRSGDR